MLSDDISELAEANVNGDSNNSALKVVCGILSGIVITVLFMWMTFPRDLATNANINAIVGQFQKQIDALEAEQVIDRADREHLNVEMGQVQQRLKMEAP